MHITSPTTDNKAAGNEEDKFVIVEKPATSARVVLPGDGGDADTDEDVDEDEVVTQDDGDFLQDFPSDTEELELVHSRIGSLRSLRLPRFGAHLRKLCLRQNVISDLDPEIMSALVELEELDLYDNKVKAVGTALDNMSKLAVLDLSFNLLKTVPDNLQNLPNLRTVYFVQNKISKITGLTSLTNLTSLELGGNRIRTIENLDGLINLEELWLGKNKITKLENLSSLKRLKILSLQSNRITKIENIESLENLEELYLSHNGVQRLEGMEHNLKLKTLDVGNNFIPAIENVSHLTCLEELWMNGNKIPDLLALDTELKQLKALQTIYLEGNPCQTEDMTGYRRKIILALPQLQQIDATYVKMP